MKELTIEELKQYQLRILKAVAEYCEGNEIKYWIDCGTLLGAVRHKGYIPWDDDIDIGMLREDYDKFIYSFNSSNERYKVYSIENNPNFYFPHAKVLDTDTVLYEPDENGLKLNINIDIFIYDNAPDDERLTKRMFKKRDRLLWAKSFRLFKYDSKNPFKKIVGRCLNFLLKVFPENYFDKRIIKNSRRYVDKKTEKVGNFSSFSRMCCDKRVFADFSKIEFEGNKYSCPVGYDEWLKAFYGDYMQLPPKEKQISHHRFKAYLTEKENEG